MARKEGPTANARASVPLDNLLLVPTATTALRFDAFFSGCTHLLYLQINGWSCLWTQLALLYSPMHTTRPLDNAQCAGKRDSVDDPL